MTESPNRDLSAETTTAASTPKDHEPTTRVLHEEDLKALSWRSIGPANMGGRVATMALVPGDSKSYFVGYATAGVWKTTNRGVTYSPIFDDKETSSIGAIDVANAPDNWAGWKDEEQKRKDQKSTEPIDRSKAGRGKIVWVGTGEGNGRNSSSWGHGVYRSTDGGGSFDHVGLSDTHDIPAIAADPRNPDVCFVAALGHLWGHNEERGVYRTNDGGKTWKRVLYIDNKTGACDLVINPHNPDVIYAAMYMRHRTKWGYQSGGPEGGIYRSTDGGKNWKKLTEGLPNHTGRIGLSLHHDDPDILVAVVESNDGGWINEPFNDRLRGGGVFRSENAGDTWERLSDYNPRAFYFSRIFLDPHDDQRVYMLGWELSISDDGGRTWRNGAAHVAHVDFHAMTIDPDDTDHLMIGTDGGVYVSYDRGEKWDFHNHMATGQFYNVTTDNSEPYRIGGGMQDNGSWIGPSETITQEKDSFMGRDGAITNQDWQFFFGGDGFRVQFHPDDPNIVYAEWQGGNIGRVHLDTGVYRKLRPQPKEGEQVYRFNWNTPFFVSPHDGTTIYHAGNVVFKLTKSGDEWTRISDDLTRNEGDRVQAAGSAAEQYGTLVALAESPVKAGVLWAGSDDGLVHMSPDDGKTWRSVSPKEAQLYYIANIEASHHDVDVAYVAIDPHRSDVFKPMLFRTDNAGKSWTSIVSNLPNDDPVKVIREDPHNPNVLYIGTQRAAYISIDRGGRWVKMNNKSLPTVPVDDFAIQVREMDLIAGTHGRSAYVLDDISPLSQLTPDIVNAPFHVFEPIHGRPRHYLPYGGLWSDKMFVANNPPLGAMIHYWIRDYNHDDVEISMKPKGGDRAIRKLTGNPKAPGINRVVWDLQREKKEQLPTADDLTEFVPAGEYEITVKQGDHEATVTVEVLAAPGT